MQLVRFSITNYRSILKTTKIEMSNFIILLGPNNEGKSNLLNALATSLRLLRNFTVVKRDDGKFIRVRQFPTHRLYNWERDFPISLQNKGSKAVTSFQIEFSLNDEEVILFKEKIGSTLNGNLPIKISIHKNGRFDFKVNKTGKGASTLSKKEHQICEFIQEHLNFEYIPAVRTAESAINVIEDIVEKQVKQLESNPNYQEAIQKVVDMQTPILQNISANITENMKDFLPRVKSLDINLSSLMRRRLFRRSIEVMIDDGEPTLLEHKGDGVQSLAALSLIKYASEQSAGSRQLILLVEEPESHLHPKAVHRLKKVLDEIGEKQQVIISSHCPLFAERLNIRNNILVSNNTAQPAKSINEIRKLLGVSISDNLKDSKLALILEGEEDVVCLRAILPKKSKILATAIKKGDLGFYSLHGAGNLSYVIKNLQDSICGSVILMDNDQAGKSAIQNALRNGYISDSDVRYTTCNHLKESEFEDLLNVEIYKDTIENKFKVDLNSEYFLKGRKKWSERIQATFQSQGKIFDDNIKKQVKGIVSNLVKSKPNLAINKKYKEIFSMLIKDLEEKLQTNN